MKRNPQCQADSGPQSIDLWRRRLAWVNKAAVALAFFALLVPTAQAKNGDKSTHYSTGERCVGSTPGGACHPTIHAASGHPLCVPRSNPVVTGFSVHQ